MYKRQSVGIAGLELSNVEPLERCFLGRVCEGSPDVTEVATGLVVEGATLKETGSTEQESSDLIQIAGGAMVPDGTTFTLPSGVVTFTVSAQSGTFDVSFDGGATQALTAREGVRKWGQITISNSGQIVITSNGDVDVIYETV